jgi:sporulation protein YlmC with PRC-barrel domain
MIRNLLATTALASLIATGAFAQEATTTAPAPADPAMQDTAAPVVKADGHLATQIIGETVYNGTGDDAQNIGDVNDIVIGADGNIEAVVIGVGGFLGIGEKNVALDFAQLDWAERDGDRWLVAPTTKEQLEQQAAFDRSAYEPAMTTAASDPAVTAPADPAVEPMDQAQTTAPADPAAPAATAPTDTTTTAAIDRSTLKEMPATEMRAEDLIGTTVYGANDANVGSIGDVLLTADGKIDAYLVDVGGFLGMGAKEVAIGSDNLAFMTDNDGNKYLYTTFTKEQLDAAAAYDKASYAEKRDAQRMMTTQ